MATVEPEPLLSICIPTFNRAHLLELCLATVLPQVARHIGEVECIVSDNCSTDRTQAVVAAAAEKYPLRSYRNESNIGGIANFTRCASELAKGRYVWLIGDDDALCAGALDRILTVLRSSDAPELVALNVSYLPPEERPSPAAAEGGVAAAADKRLRTSGLEGSVRFDDLFEGPCADLTACYASILKRSLWRKHFPATCFDPPFTSVRTTYPHAWIIAQEMPGKMASLIATPSVMIYELPASQYSWSKFRALCALIYSTQLLQLFERRGVPGDKLRPYYLYQLSDRAAELGEFLWNRSSSAGGIRAALQFAWLMRRYPLRVLKAFAIAALHSQAPRGLAAVANVLLKLRRSVRPRTYLSRNT